MTIALTDLKLKASERLTDTDDGGGLMTGQEVLDGEINNLFPDISRLDRTAGKVNLRKVFVHVDTSNTDILYGAHLIVTREPQDPRVHLTLFETGVVSDERTGARNFIESYVIRGPTSPIRLYDTQQAGQRSLLGFCEVAAVLPDIGEVLCLSLEAAGFPAQEQYVRITDIERETQTFSYEDGSTKDWSVLHIDMASPLAAQYPGDDPGANKVQPLSLARTKVRLTQAADIANYYGISKLTTPAEAGARLVQVQSVYGRIVPATTTEEPLIDQSAAGDAVLYAAVAGPVTININTSIPATRFVGSAIQPGSVRVLPESGGTLRDVDGQLVYEGTGSAVSGEVDYESGRIKLQGYGNPFDTDNAVTYTPAARVAQIANTFVDPVEVETRRYNYVRSLSPRPAPGSLRISYRALGRWYTIRDNGRGGLTGDLPNTGSGVVNYDTGSLIVTLGALPDVGSGVLYSWGQSNEYMVQTGVLTVPAPVIRLALGKAIEPGSLSISWTYLGAKTASANSAGSLSGHATGTADHASGEVAFRPSVLPPSNTVYTVSYTEQLSESEMQPLVDAGGLWNLTLAETPIEAGSVILDLPPAPGSLAPILRDDGQGHFTAGTATVGSINYSSGEITLPKTLIQIGSRQERYLIGAVYSSGGGVAAAGTGYGGNVASRSYAAPVYGVQNAPIYLRIGSGTALIRYRVSGAGTSAGSEQVNQGPLTLDLTPTVSDVIVPGSVRFTFSGRTYYDRNGQLLANQDTQTGAGIVSGSINYDSGEATLDLYSGDGGSVALLGLLTSALRPQTYQVFFRTPGAPLAVASLIVTAAALDGTAISATANSSGQMVGDLVQGQVDFETGVVELVFGDTGPIDDGQGGTTTGFRPLVVDPGSIRYGAVLLTTLPLDAEVLGLDPTRLPLDGRVPIFRPGQVAVVHHSGSEVLPAPLAAGDTYTLSRQPVSSAVLRDENGLLIPTAFYTVNLSTGVITFAAPLDLSGYQEPLQAETRIEHMSLLTDVQINGQLTLQRGLPFLFPAGESRVSSALIVGDTGARVANVFTQKTWTNAWSNNRIGDDSVGKYNDVLSPLIVANRSAITERWAVVFTSPTAFQVIGEFSGVIATGSIATDTAPINPQTGLPYFTIEAAGWGSGWVASNVLRFNTIAASAPAWIARTIESGPASASADQGQVEFRGDAD